MFLVDSSALLCILNNYVYMDSGHLITKWVVKNMSVRVILILLFSEVKKNAY